MARTTVSSRVLRWLPRLATPAYYDGSHVYSLVASAETDSWAEMAQMPFCLVLSRACYQEELRAFPAVEVDELKAILKLEYAADPSIRYSIVEQEFEAAKRYVMVWRLKQGIDLGYRLWLPETLLLSISLQRNQVVQYSSGVKEPLHFWLGRSPKGVVSTPVTSAINNAQLFAMGASLPEPEHVDRLESLALPKALLEGLKRVSLINWFEFLPNVSMRSLLPKLAISLVPLTVMLVAYLGLSSAYLAWQAQSLNQNLSSVNGDVAEILEARSRYENEVASLAGMSEWLQDQYPVTSAWLVLRPLLDTTRVEIFRTEYDRIVIAGTAPRATEVLERLSTDPRVLDARFDEATSQSGNRDFFTISFVLNDSGVR